MGLALPTDSVSLQVNAHFQNQVDLVCQNSFIEGLFIGEGVAVDKTIKCGRYKTHTALVGSVPLHLNDLQNSRIEFLS